MELGGEPKLSIFSLNFRTSECHHSRPFICEAPPSIFSVKYSKEVNFGITKANFVPSIEHYEIKEGDIRSLFGYLENKKLTVVLKETNASSIALKAVDRKWPGAQVPVVISDSFDWRWYVSPLSCWKSI